MSHRFRTAKPRNSTAAGYGWAHQTEARRRRAIHTPADLCGYCHRPLGPERLPGDTSSRWHLPHNETRTGYLPGLWHAACNRREGAQRGGRKALALRRTRLVQRRRLLG